MNRQGIKVPIWALDHRLAPFDKIKHIHPTTTYMSKKSFKSKPHNLPDTGSSGR
jgi:hypothetical protein